MQPCSVALRLSWQSHGLEIRTTAVAGLLKGCLVMSVQLKSASVTSAVLFSTLQMVTVNTPQKPEPAQRLGFSRPFILSAGHTFYSNSFNPHYPSRDVK